ncbi:heat shock protein DnaJ domain protein [Solidesulfovibrio carbinoliphilus subsp. oakridgensis]|uniref:Heat shock protein DnaJ domain protein n=1 Tax=Solidesulfovibrio carbinoliphilus subsp. oakridgensis TaxID=694327 RepID=G7Q9A7_9BACT|nr:DnaJ domain-containing protein [Solidesulfovibrio carbinoliphilus]EHJ48150.1 heat shock protein DnaJ domain protein [Solidesulfovibrio carbinoliphilus subsp. oakridgensis]
MHRQTQGQGGCGAKTAYGGTDWQALEIQLNRTRNILQDILVHLQEVLRNLKMARHGDRGFAAAADATGPGRFGAKDTRFRAEAKASAHTAHGQRTQQAGPSAAGGSATAGRAHASHATGAAGRPHAAGTGGSDWFRARARQNADTRAETGPGRASRPTPGPEAASENARSRPQAGAGEQARPNEGRTFRAGPTSSRTQAPGGQAGRERPRAESTFRASAAGAEREARQGPAAGQAAAGAGASSRTHARTTARAAGFRLDQDRQSRARQMARRSGMNLKCAYDILCLDYPCTVDELKVAYRHMARLYHPDLGGDEEAMKDVNVAYELAMRFCAGPRRASAAWAV